MAPHHLQAALIISVGWAVKPSKSGSFVREYSNLLTKLTLIKPIITNAIFIKNAILDKPMNTRVLPVCWIFYITMLDGVIMNIIDVMFIVGAIADDMFPEPTLPNTSFTLFLSRTGNDFMVINLSREC